MAACTLGSGQRRSSSSRCGSVVIFALEGDPGDTDAEIIAWYADAGNRDQQVIDVLSRPRGGLVLRVVPDRVCGVGSRRPKEAAGTLTALAFGAGLVAVGSVDDRDVRSVSISFAVDVTDEFVVEPNIDRLSRQHGLRALVRRHDDRFPRRVIGSSVLQRDSFLPKWLGWVGFSWPATMLVVVLLHPLPDLARLGARRQRRSS